MLFGLHAEKITNRCSAGALHHIIARGSVQATCLRLPVCIRTCLRASHRQAQTGASHRQVGKSVIRDVQKAKAKKSARVSAYKRPLHPAHKGRQGGFFPG